MLILAFQGETHYKIQILFIQGHYCILHVRRRGLRGTPFSRLIVSSALQKTCAEEERGGVVGLDEQEKETQRRTTRSRCPAKRHSLGSLLILALVIDSGASLLKPMCLIKTTIWHGNYC